MQNIESILEEKKIFIGKTAGDSMEPMLCEGHDTVIIVPPVFPLKTGDVPVYRRDGHYTMHRIIKATKKRYYISGDNRKNLETDVKERDIVGVLAAFYKEQTYVSCDDPAYLDYTKKMCRRFPRLLWMHAVKGFGGKILNFCKGR